MKARELQELLETDRTIHFSNGCICIASLYCHNLISLDTNTFKVSYALGGRPTDAEVRKLVNDLQSLKQSEIEYYLNGYDEIKDPITVYYCNEDGEIKTTITDSLDFPSITHDGVLIYANTHFKSKDAMLGYEIKNTKATIDFYRTSLDTKRREIDETYALLAGQESKLLKLNYATREVQNG